MRHTIDSEIRLKLELNEKEIEQLLRIVIRAGYWLNRTPTADELPFEKVLLEVLREANALIED